MSRPRGYFKYFVHRLVILLVHVLPRSVCYWLARRISWFNYTFDRRAREGVIANLRVTLGPDASESLVRHHARRTFCLYGMFLVDFFGVRRFGPRILAEEFHATGEELFARTVEKRGVVLVTAHFGNWELGGTYLSRKGYKTLGIAMRHPEVLMEKLFAHLRRDHNNEFVLLEDAMRRCVQAAREQKRVILVMGDRPVGEKGVEVEIFGHTACFPQGPARIALRTGAALFPGFMVRRMNGPYLLHFGEPIEAPASGSVREKARAMTQAYAKQLEEMVRSYPCQWYLFFKVFDPPGGVVPDPAREALERLQRLANARQPAGTTARSEA